MRERDANQTSCADSFRSTLSAARSASTQASAAAASAASSPSVAAPGSRLAYEQQQKQKRTSLRGKLSQPFEVELFSSSRRMTELCLVYCRIELCSEEEELKCKLQKYHHCDAASTTCWWLESNLDCWTFSYYCPLLVASSRLLSVARVACKFMVQLSGSIASCVQISLKFFSFCVAFFTC